MAKRPLHAYQARNGVGTAAVRYQTNMDEALNEYGTLRCEGQVARIGDVGSGPGRHPVYRCEHGLGQGADGANDGVVLLLNKVLKLRVFADGAGKMNLSLQDVGGGLLIVSQFTLAADTSGGNRPGFTNAAPPALGESLYDAFVAAARAAHPQVATGRFGADMQVHLVNDGPVTIPMRLTA